MDETIEFDHHSPEYAKNAAETYRDLIARCPVHRTTAHGGFVVAVAHDAVFEAARDETRFTSHRETGTALGGILIPPSVIRSGLIETRTPDFFEQRRAVNPWFAPAAVERIQPRIQELTTRLVDGFIERGDADLIDELASPVPAIMTMELLGLPGDDWPKYADVFHRGVYVRPGTPERDEIDALRREVLQQVTTLALARRAEPTDDLLSFFANLRLANGDLLPPTELMGNALLLLAGGIDTTTALASNTFLHLHQDHGARAWLLEDLDRLPVACEEYLRFVSPVQGLARTVTRDTTLAGTAMAENERVWLSWAGANRDPTIFEDPDTIRLDRWPNRHAAFGLGPHRCIGSNLARMMWRVMVAEVLTRLPDYEIDESRVVGYPTIGVVNGLIAMPCRFTPGSRGTV